MRKKTNFSLKAMVPIDGLVASIVPHVPSANHFEMLSVLVHPCKYTEYTLY